MPLMDVFWSMLWFFLFFAWIWVLITVFGDIFRSPDLSGWGKGLWTVFVVFLPWLGVLVYLIARGLLDARAGHGGGRAAREGDTPIHPGGLVIGVCRRRGVKLAELKERGVLTEAEFNSQKAALLG